jgi:hypothetical protein
MEQARFYLRQSWRSRVHYRPKITLEARREAVWRIEAIRQGNNTVYKYMFLFLRLLLGHMLKPAFIAYAIRQAMWHGSATEINLGST